MVAIILGADNGFFYAGQVMHFSSPFTVFLLYHKQRRILYSTRILKFAHIYIFIGYVVFKKIEFSTRKLLNICDY